MGELDYTFQLTEIHIHCLTCGKQTEHSIQPAGVFTSSFICKKCSSKNGSFNHMEE